MIDYLFYLLYRFLFFLVRLLPGGAGRYLGQGLGALAYKLTGRRSEIAADNLKRAYGGVLTEEQIQQRLKGIYRHFGMMMIEFLYTDRLNKETLDRYITLEGQDHLDRAFEEGQGVIIYSAHFGNWEWLAIALAQLGYPITAVAKRQKNENLDRLINDLRQRNGLNIIFKGFSLREAFRSLKRGEALYLLGDQNARSGGWQMEFFGQKTSTFTGPVQLARRTGALILPVFMIREGWLRYRLSCHQPYHLAPEATRDEEEELLQELTNLTEKVIREYPEQWLWLHRRWKY